MKEFFGPRVPKAQAMESRLAVLLGQERQSDRLVAGIIGVMKERKDHHKLGVFKFEDYATKCTRWPRPASPWANWRTRTCEPCKAGNGAAMTKATLIGDSVTGHPHGRPPFAEADALDCRPALLAENGSSQRSIEVAERRQTPRDLVFLLSSILLLATRGQGDRPG